LVAVPDPKCVQYLFVATFPPSRSCTTVQFVVGGALRKVVAGEDKTRRLTNLEQMGCGIGAGAVSSLVGSPLELIMIQQQRKGGNLIE